MPLKWSSGWKNISRCTPERSPGLFLLAVLYTLHFGQVIFLPMTIAFLLAVLFAPSCVACGSGICRSRSGQPYSSPC